MFLFPLAAGPKARFMEEVRSSVQEIHLPNGLKVLLVEKHDAPTFAYASVVGVGGVDEKTGYTGLAHMLEHMAFKGTPTVGTKDYKKEKKLHKRMDEVWGQVLRERWKGARADSAKLQQLEEEFRRLQEQASELVISNQFVEILERNGGVMVNANTGTDRTMYHYKLPSNRAELCFRLEGERLSHPVFREFYKERDVIMNERRLRMENSPYGRLMEELLGISYSAHPYGQATIGFASDIANFHRPRAYEFFRQYYVASNITFAFVGDLTREQVERFGRKYLMEIPRGERPGPVTTVEPEHAGQRRLIIEGPANPVLVMAWMVPAASDPASVGAEILFDLLGRGRTSRLHRRLVQQEHLAADVGAFTGLPGSLYPALGVVFVYLAAGQDPEDAERVVWEEIEKLKQEGPDEAEVARAKVRNKAGFIRMLREPAMLAASLAEADRLYGDWEEMFERFDRMEQITTADVHALARKLLERKGVVVAVYKKASDALER